MTAAAGARSSAQAREERPDVAIKDLVEGVSDSAGALIAELSSNPMTAPIADAAREALTQGVSVAAWIGIAALVVGLLTTIPLGRRQAEAASDQVEPIESGSPAPSA